MYFRSLVKPRSRSFPATDVCFTQHQALCGDAALSHIVGVVRSRLPAFIQLGKLPVQATATKHAGQVWLWDQYHCTEHQQSGASERWTLSLSSQRLQTATAGLALHQGGTAVLKSFLTVSHLRTPPLPLLDSANFIFCPPLSPSCCFLFSVTLTKCQEPRRSLRFPHPWPLLWWRQCHVLKQGQASSLSADDWAVNEVWSLTSKASAKWSCVNHCVSPVQAFGFVFFFFCFLYVQDLECQPPAQPIHQTDQSDVAGRH